MSGKGIFRGDVQGQIVQGGNIRSKLSGGENLWRGNVRERVLISVQLHAVVMTFATLVNTYTHTHTHTHTQPALAGQLAEQKKTAQLSPTAQECFRKKPP